MRRHYLLQIVCMHRGVSIQYLLELLMDLLFWCRPMWNENDSATNLATTVDGGLELLDGGSQMVDGSPVSNHTSN
jgi:hypothetical protein